MTLSTEHLDGSETGREAAEQAGDPAKARVDEKRVESLMREFLDAIGEDPDREGIRRTPGRIARMYTELLRGYEEDPRKHLAVTFPEDHHEIVLLKGIPFASLCEHHFLPFTGYAHLAYIPAGRVVGLSKLARLVEGYARRPQVQERMTGQIADALVEALAPAGAGVVIQGSHSCMAIRGIQKPGAVMLTSALRGTFLNDTASRSELLSLLRLPDQGFGL
ncbi:GTP cyclohydrolase I FolE [Streptomyces sp. NPDC019224]|uniref:GTP cyclohydrolase I FolE n=1 Tax=Streptomyces sp. NPDC019224 TaxID=3154484 RepID=UPI0033F0337B